MGEKFKHVESWKKDAFSMLAENWKLKLKTEKYYNKIIFKCVNSTVRPIFNKKITEKWNL